MKMIEFMQKPHNEEETKEVLNDLVKGWFFNKFKSFSLPQLYGVLEIHKKNNILVSAPTGGTKTLTAFLSIINELTSLDEKNELKDQVYCVYISPLKALNRDIEKNLKEPLQEIEKIAGRKLGIRVGVRTGDTTASEKQKMLKNPPHILITTPESLAIMLTSVKFKELLKNVKYVIMDECLPYNTFITLSNGKKIKIGDIVERNLTKGELVSKVNGNIYVKSLDENTGKIIDKKIVRVHKIPNNKKLLKINTKYYFSRLELTENHPIAVLNKKNCVEWKLANKLKVGDNILLYNFLQNDKKPLKDKINNRILISEKQFRNVYLRIFKNKQGKGVIKKLEKSITKLRENGLLPLRYSSDKLPILSRLVGHLFGDGWLTITERTRHLGFSGDLVDLRDISEDIVKLGFRVHSNTSRETSSIVNDKEIRGISNQILVCSKPLSILFMILGVPVGNKTNQSYLLPHWLKKAPKFIKKEFLSSFLGAEGMKPIPAPIKNYFYAPRLSLNKRSDLIGNGVILSRQIRRLFDEFGVSMSSLKVINGNMRKDGSLTKKIVMTFRNNEENLLLLYGSIGFQYCMRKAELARKASLYINAKLLARKNKIDLIENIKKLKKRRIPYRQIAKEFGLEAYKGKHYKDGARRLVDWLTRERKNKRILKNFPSFDYFVRELSYGDCCIDKVIKIDESNNKLKFVYDLTIEDTHNFIADNIVVHNCHALADNKRGVHLSLSLERLQYICNEEFTRIGLSATVAPLENIAGFLVGNRDCKIANVEFTKKMDLKVISPVKDLINVSYDELNNAMYNMMDNLIQEHKTTLIFTNTRSATERVVHHLKEKFPKKYTENIGAHHGSLSKKHRHDMEDRLRKGELKCIVCSTSLELGIDIGYIDLVICLGSPKSVARFLQRVGRSGHKLHDVVKGRIIVLDRDDLIECSVLLKNAVERKIDRIHIPENCLDVLAQQIYGIAIADMINIKDLFNLIKSSYCYRNLDEKDFDDIIDYLTGKHISLEDRHVYAKIWHDEETGMIGKKGKLARVLYMTNIGTIPDETFVIVRIQGNDEVIGTIEESFLERLKRGDVFVLGGARYEFLYSKGMVAYVNASVYRPPTIPSWFSEMLPLSFDLAIEIGKFRKYMEERFNNKESKKEILEFINSYLYVDENAALAIYSYFNEQFLYLKEIPNYKKIIIEFYKDENANKKYAVFHSLYGRRVNDVLSRVLAFALGKIHHSDFEIGINDNGFYIASNKEMQVLNALKLLKSEELYEVAKKSIENTEVLKRRFRHCATRALMILREYKGHKKRVGKQQVASQILINAVKRIDENFSILKEARREVLEDLMDVENAVNVIKGIEEKKIEIKQCSTNIPSSFAFNIVLQGYTDIFKIEDKMEFLKRMHDMVLAKIGKENLI